jgi:hypothetical protein
MRLGLQSGHERPEVTMDRVKALCACQISKVQRVKGESLVQRRIGGPPGEQFLSFGDTIWMHAA